MLPYYILIGMPMLVGAVRNKGKVRIGDGIARDRRNAEITSFFLILTVLLMFRGGSCGIDTDRYRRIFNSAHNQSWSDVLAYTEREIGYSVLNKLLSVLTSNSQLLVMVTAVLTIAPLWRFYRREAELPILTILLFVTVAPFSMYFSGIKQAIAMGFAFPAWYCVKKKKWVKFLLIVLAAMLFHQSAFILLALYPLYHLRITPKWLYVVVPLMLVVYVYNGPIFNTLSRLLWEDYGEARSSGSATILFLLAIFAVYAFFIPDEELLEPDVIALRNILLLTVVIQCFAPVHSLAMRMNYYFLPFIPILIPKIANRSKLKYKMIANISVIVMTAFFVLYYFLKAHTGSDALQLYPYIFCWAQ